MIQYDTSLFSFSKKKKECKKSERNSFNNINYKKKMQQNKNIKCSSKMSLKIYKKKKKKDHKCLFVFRLLDFDLFDLDFLVMFVGSMSTA